MEITVSIDKTDGNKHTTVYLKQDAVMWEEDILNLFQATFEAAGFDIKRVGVERNNGDVIWTME